MQPVVATIFTALLVGRAYTNKSLTPVGIITAGLTAVAHAVHPWSVFFTLLTVFFLGGTAATKVKHHQKSQLTLSAAGASPNAAPEPRNHVQVLANSGVASALILAHTYLIYTDAAWSDCWPGPGRGPGDLLVIGIVSNYAAVAADTFSSELGILSRSDPFLITVFPPRKVPRGTNGGVSVLGVGAGALGAFIVGVTSALLLPFCPTSVSQTVSAKSDSVAFAGGWTTKEVAIWIAAVTLWGSLGSLMDSVLGGLVQASVVDTRSGKVVEGAGGRKVQVTTSSTPSRSSKTLEKPGRRVVAGFDILDNNGVNFLMAFVMSVGGMLVAAWLFGFESAQSSTFFGTYFKSLLDSRSLARSREL